MYLEPIFSAPDIQKQLPTESKAFDHVHRQLRDIMRRTKDRPNALQTGSNPGKGHMQLLVNTSCLIAMFSIQDHEPREGLTLAIIGE